MWTCKKCGKPVYFAERIQSLGFDWHPPCLVCSECGKKLHPGQHAEHAAEPYCHHPCYGALFGPRVFGHGTRNECHRAFGKRSKEADTDRQLLEAKLKEYNAVHEGKPGEIRRREVNGRPVLEGILRIHWGVECLIHLKQEDPGEGSGPAPTGGVSPSLSGAPDSDEEPLWRDDSPPSSTPSTPQTTPNPNWPPTPYPTLKPSDPASPNRGGGPQASPVLSYTHNAPPSPVVHPLSVVDVVHCPNGVPPTGEAVAPHQEDFTADFTSPDSRYNTMKSCTIRRRETPTRGAWINGEGESQNTPPEGGSDAPEGEKEEAPLKKGGLVKRVSFSRVDWGERLKGRDAAPLGDEEEKERTSPAQERKDVNGFPKEVSPQNGRGVDGPPQNGKSVDSSPQNGRGVDGSPQNGKSAEGSPHEGRGRGRAVLRRRPGLRMDKRRVKRRCSINGHYYLRETSSFHLSSDCPPAVVRASSITTTTHIITTVLEKYKIEMSSSNFVLCVVKDTGERRRLGPTETPLVLRVLLGPHEDVARLVLCDAAVSSDVTPEMAEFLHLSLAECRAILRRYEIEEKQQLRALRAKYDELKAWCLYLLDRAPP